MSTCWEYELRVRFESTSWEYQLELRVMNTSWDYELGGRVKSTHLWVFPTNLYDLPFFIFLLEFMDQICLLVTYVSSKV